MKVIIFGLGQIYERYKYLFEDMQIVAFMDNDMSKWGKKIDDIIVDKPQNINKYRFDYIIITSTYYKEIREQLLELGVDADTIIDKEHKGIYSGMHTIHKYSVSRPEWDKRKRILLVSHTLSLSGAPIVLYNLACVLKELGYDVEIYSLPNGELIHDFLKEGVSVSIFDNFDFDSHEIKNYFSQYDLIVVNTLVLFELVNDLNSCNIPILWWLHEEDSVYEHLDLKNWKLFENQLLHVYGVGNRVLQAFEKYIGSKTIEKLMYGLFEKKQLMPQFANNPYFKSNYLKMKNEKIIFAIIGYVCKIKAQDVFVNVVNKNWNSWKERAEFWIIGEISLELKTKYEEYGTVQVFGSMDHRELLEIYNNIDVIVCPSRNDSMPVVLAEGMQHKKVCIASDMTGTAEFIVPYENGLLCRAGDEISLAENIQWVLDNTNKMQQMGESAFETYQKEFSMEAFRIKVKESVEKCLSQFMKG